MNDVLTKAMKLVSEPLEDPGYPPPQNCPSVKLIAESVDSTCY